MAGPSIIVSMIVGLLSAVPFITPAFDHKEPVGERTAAKPQGPGREHYIPLLQDLIAKVGSGDADAAADLFNRAAGGNPSELNSERIKIFHAQLSEMHKRFGSIEGAEFVAMKTVSSRVHLVYALAYYHSQPVLFRFRMYRINDGWRITEFNWNQQITELQDQTPLVRLDAKDSAK